MKYERLQYLIQPSGKVFTPTLTKKPHNEEDSEQINCNMLEIPNNRNDYP